MSHRWHVSAQPDQEAADHLRPLLASRGCTFAVPGGSTPGPALRLLFADGALPGVQLTLVDERHRAAEADDNSLALVQLLAGLGASNPVVRWDLDLPLEDAVSTLAEQVPQPTVALLGIGPDGHVASLFPGRTWGEPGQRVISVLDSPKPPPTRLTFTLEALRRIPHLVAVVRGAGKAEAARRAHALDPALPTSHLPNIHWFVDHDAATLLPESP